ncbi:hypothetical protein YC2023_093009 [Brassica napus]
MKTSDQGFYNLNCEVFDSDTYAWKRLDYLELRTKWRVFSEIRKTTIIIRRKVSSTLFEFEFERRIYELQQFKKNRVGSAVRRLTGIIHTYAKPLWFLSNDVVLVAGAASSWLSFGDDGRYQTAKKSLDLTKGLLTARTETVVSSLLTVECVTKGEYELGCTDEERRCIWRKTRVLVESFGRDLVIGKEKCCSKMSVWLVMNEKPLLTKRTFTCGMRLQYTCHENEVSSITSPCDGCKMNDGTFAWRAIFLGR